MSPLNEIRLRAMRAHARYGNFASTHEALGVALEEWDELREAVHRNGMSDIADEAIDLAAVLLRLAEHCLDEEREAFKERSGF